MNTLSALSAQILQLDKLAILGMEVEIYIYER